MKIVVIDGQGGRIGKLVIERINELCANHELIAIGTNSLATAAMIKAGAKKAATGENPVVVNVRKADVIIGPIGIIMANSLLGEVTEKMAVETSSSDAYKILIPVSKCNHKVVGLKDLSIDEYIEQVYNEVKAILG